MVSLSSDFPTKVVYSCTFVLSDCVNILTTDISVVTPLMRRAQTEDVFVTDFIVGLKCLGYVLDDQDSDASRDKGLTVLLAMAVFGPALRPSYPLGRGGGSSPGQSRPLASI